MAGNARGVHSRARLTYKRRSLLLFFPSPVAPLPYLYRPARRRTDAVKSQGRRDCHTTHDRQSAPNWRHAIANELRIGTECSRESLRKKTALWAALRLTFLWFLQILGTTLCNIPIVSYTNCLKKTKFNSENTNLKEFPLTCQWTEEPCHSTLLQKIVDAWWETVRQSV